MEGQGYFAAASGLLLKKARVYHAGSRPISAFFQPRYRKA